MAKDLCPEAEIRIKIPGYEELDAFIEVVVPDEMVEEVDDRLHELTARIFDEENYWVGVYVVERSLRQPKREQGNGVRDNGSAKFAGDPTKDSGCPKFAKNHDGDENGGGGAVAPCPRPRDGRQTLHRKDALAGGNANAPFACH